MPQVVSNFFASHATDNSSQSSSRFSSGQSESDFEQVLDKTTANHDSDASRHDKKTDKLSKKERLSDDVENVQAKPEDDEVPLEENQESKDQLDADEAALAASAVQAESQLQVQDDSKNVVTASASLTSGTTLIADANADQVNPLLEAAGQSNDQGASENPSKEKSIADAMLKLLGVSTGQTQQQATFTLADAAPQVIQTDSTTNTNAPQALQLPGQDDADLDSSNVSRVSRALQNAIQQKGGTITIRMMPPELGQVRVDIQMDGGKVTASFQTESQSIQNLMSRELGQLRLALEKQGLTVERLEVTQRPASTNTSNQTQQESQQQHQSPSDGRSRGQYAQQQQSQTGEAGSVEDELNFESELQNQI